MGKRSNTTKDIGLLRQLHTEGQLRLAPEFQRNAVWPAVAKAYLIDTILEEKPMPLFFFERSSSAQTGKLSYSVVDGQQRLRAILEFMDDRFRLTQSKDRRYKNKRFSELSLDLQSAISNYDISVQELSGYSEAEIRDIFVRMNKYVVKLSAQELRHAKEQGAFYGFVEQLGALPFWKDNGIFTKSQIKRMRNTEFAAEMAILLIEGPQDKKRSVDLYYGEYQRRFPYGNEVKRKFGALSGWVQKAIPDLRDSRFRRPTDFYSLIGALDRMLRGSTETRRLDPIKGGKKLLAFERDLNSKQPSRSALAYLAAASRQTDNIAPRTTRIEAISLLLTELE